MSPTEWLRYATSSMGPFPDDYLVVDCETSGLAPRDDVVIQLGWALVEGRKLVDQGAVVIDWTRDQPPAYASWLADRIDKTRFHIEHDKNGYSSGNTWNFHIARVQAEGCHPRAAMEDFRGLVDTCRAGGFSFVGHFGLRCDQPMLHRAMQDALGSDAEFVLAPGEYHDTMALEKGVQILPRLEPGEDWDRFIRRAYGLGGNKFKSSLSDHCVRKYDLHTKHALDMTQAHEADFDAVLTHHLFENFRGIMETKP